MTIQDWEFSEHLTCVSSTIFIQFQQSFVTKFVISHSKLLAQGQMVANDNCSWFLTRMDLTHCRYIEYDSWWYPKGPRKGVTEWTSMRKIFPQGLR